MRFIQGTNRHQILMFPNSLEDTIEADNEVRKIDMFVDMLDMRALGFDITESKAGRPAYNPSDLIKLFIYGAQNKIKSDRLLEKACKLNIEVMWLMKCLQPDHNTLYVFKKNNAKIIKKCIKDYRGFFTSQAKMDKKKQ